MYSFQIVKVIDESGTTVEVAYASHENSDDHLKIGLSDIIEKFNRRVSPSRLLIICPDGMEEKVKQCFDELYDDIEGRLVTISHITIAPYDENGSLVPDRVGHFKSEGPTWFITDDFLLEVAHDGISTLFDETETVLHAPHGYVFHKLSGRDEQLFVRAGNMLREPGCMSIFNQLLLRQLPSDCSYIYIDSFTILSFALGLQSIVRYFRDLGRSLPALAIKNTHSYEVSDDFRIPNEENYLVLISASTSGSLARKLVEHHHADPQRIVHLFGIGPPDAEFSKTCVYYRDRSTISRQRTTAHPTSTPIEIGTGNYSPAFISRL